MNPTRDILLVEPFCVGFEHAAFNAALTRSFLHAFPEDRCVFHGERTHLASVSGLLERTAPEAYRRVVWNEIVIADRAWAASAQLLHARRLASALSPHTGRHVRVVAYAACTEMDLFALKEILFRRGTDVPHCAVLHGVLRTSLFPSRRKVLPGLRGMRLMFRLPQPRGLRYLALGEPVLRELHELLPGPSRYVRAIDLPYVWKDHEIPEPVLSAGRPVFGYLGVSATAGFEVFLDIVREARRRGIPAEFRMVGHVSGEGHRSRLADLGVDTPPGVLSDDAFTQRGRSITYALWTIPREEYRLTASTSFLEALAIVRPGIHLRNPYLEHYFRRMGDIGYLCDSPGEIIAQVSAICSQLPLERYRRQCQTIVESREIFSPQAVGLQLRAIVSELAGGLPA